MRKGLPLQVLFSSIHPDDQQRVAAALDEAMARGGPYRCDYRVRRKDGRYGWIIASGRVEMDAEGRSVRFPGVLLDDGDRRRIAAERDRANVLLRTFIEAVRGLDRTQGGLGIGLALVRTIVQAHGGSVSAHSESKRVSWRQRSRLPP